MASALVVCTSCFCSGCYSIDDYVHIKREDPPMQPDIDDSDDDPFGPSNPGDNKHPGGSSGVIPDDDPDDSDNDHGQIDENKPLKLEILSPSQGKIDGGYEVRVMGQSLSETGKLRFGQIEAPQQQFVNSGVVRAVVPPGKNGCVDVFWEQNDATVVLENGFCYFEDIVVESISPTVVVEGQRIPLTISGKGFDKNTRVSVFTEERVSPLLETRVVSESTLVGDLPDLRNGKASISVVGPMGSVVLNEALTVLPPLKAERVTPAYARSAQSVSFLVEGSGFDEETHVRVGAREVTAKCVDAHHLSFEYSSDIPGFYDVLIYDSQRQVRLDAGIYIADHEEEAKIVNVLPNYGSHRGNTEIEIVGFGLPMVGEAYVGEKNAGIQSKSADSWRIVTPSAHTAEYVDISIGGMVFPKGFEYVIYPELSSVTPNREEAGAIVQLQGEAFTSDLRVFFGGQESPEVSVLSSSLAQAVVPPGYGNAPIRLVQGRAESATEVTFSYVSNIEIVGQSTHEVVVSGGTQVALYGGLFDNEMKIQVDGVECEFKWVSPNEIQFIAPAHKSGHAAIEVFCAENVVCATAELTYFDPVGKTMGASGGVIDGAVYVSVYSSSTGKPIEKATVYLGVDESALTKVTDTQGRVSFEDASIVGGQIVMACAENFSCATMQPVNARDITLLLDPWKSSSGTPDTDPPPPPPTPDKNGTINPIDITIPYTPKPAYFTGTVGDFGKVELVSNPNHIRAGLVIQSALSAYALPYQKDDVYLITEVGAKYKLRARTGQVALALVCGLYDSTTSRFTPKYLGVKRHLFATDGANVETHLDCEIPLNQTMPIKMLDAPLKSGPNGVNASAFLNLGSDGYIGGFMNGSSNTDFVVLTGLPPLRAELYDASFEISVGAYTDGGYPATVLSTDNVTYSDKTLEIGPAVPLPKFLTRDSEDILHTGKLEWSVEYPQNVDYYAITIRMYSMLHSGDLLFQAYLPGSATTFEFPQIYAWPEDGSGQIYIQLIAYKSVRQGFDFNLFSTAELRYNYIHSSAYTTLIIRDPAAQTAP